MKPTRTFRWVALGLLGLYVLIPVAASVQFSLEAGYKGRLSFSAYSQALAEAGPGHEPADLWSRSPPELRRSLWSCWSQR